MPRLLYALGALVTSCAGVASVGTSLISPATQEAKVIGAESPVNLGTMTVTATALPER